jgi:hypothetical protein
MTATHIVVLHGGDSRECVRTETEAGVVYTHVLNSAWGIREGDPRIKSVESLVKINPIFTPAAYASFTPEQRKLLEEL